jgi:REP element-mobilizing transposase RayT
MTVLATHVILSMYGFWLPNDPRGSGSKYTGSDELYESGGKATKVDTRHSLAKKPHDKQKREKAKTVLKHPPVLLKGQQALAVANGFATLEHLIYACAVMPEHVHLVLGRSTVPAKKVAEQLKDVAEGQLRSENIFPDCETIWARGCWQVFLNTPDDVHRTIRYVNENPVKAGFKCQHWSFVTKPPF